MQLTPKTRIYVAGHGGLVGSAIVRRLEALGCCTILTATRAQLDLRDQAAVQYWFRANYERLRRMTENRGGNQPNLNGVLLRELEVALPALTEQRRIAADLALRLVEAERLTAILREEFAAIDALSAALLREAFNGQA